MPGDKKIAQSQPSVAVLKFDGVNLSGQNVAPRNEGVPLKAARSYPASAISSVKGGVDRKEQQGFHYPPTSCYDYHYPGYSGAYGQLDGSNTENGSLLYLMPSYNPYATGTFLGVDGQQPYFPTSEGMPPCYSWDNTYTGDAKSAATSNGSMKSNGYNSKRTMNNTRSSNYPLDANLPQSTSNLSKSILQSSHLNSLDKLGSSYQSKGYQPSANFSYQSGGLFSNYFVNYAPSAARGREKLYVNGESEELTRGPRSQGSLNPISLSNEDEKYNLEDFQTVYDHARFYIIKSYSEDDVHKCIKYNVWSSTPNGNKKLDAAFHDAEVKTRETGSKCPIFLLFSVNGSGQFVGVAEMIGPVDFEKNMDFWQLDKWSGFFEVKWHIVKDVPNTQLRHIILENNDNRPVTYTRDTQEVGLKQGLEMLEIFKSYSAKTSLLDDLSFYENREKLLKAKRMSKPAEKSQMLGEGPNGLINLTRNLSLGPAS